MREGRLIALLTLTALLATACGGAGSGSAASSSKPAATAASSSGGATSGGSTGSGSTGSGSASGGSTSGGSASGAPIKLTFVQSQNILSYAPAYVARAEQYLKKDGIDATFDAVAGDGPVYAALSGGSAQFGIGDAAGVLNFGAKGLDVEAVYAMDRETMDVAASAKWVKAHNVTSSTPIKQRILALKGATWGYTSPGSASETAGRYLVSWAGMNPQNPKDAVFARIGGLPARQAALKSGQIQAYLSSPPGPQQAAADGFGYVLIPPQDMPGLSGVYNEVLVVSKSWAAKNPKIVREVTAAFANGTNILTTDPTKAVSLVQQYFPKVDKAVLTQSIQDIDPALVPGGKMQASEWQQSAAMLIKIKSLKSNVDMSEGKYWTNAYLGNG